MKKIRYVAFGTLLLLMLLLAAASVAEKVRGTSFVNEYIYSSVWFVALWGIAALAGAAWLVVLREKLRPASLLLHLSLLAILVGALLTWLAAERGTLHLREGSALAGSFIDANGTERPLPFEVGLDEFRVRYYAGTRAPADYCSRLRVVDACDTLRAEVSMNRIFRMRHYRFYQSGFDPDGGGTILSVAYDPWGINLTYAGYLLFALAALALPFDRKTRLRGLLRGRRLRRAACVGILLAACVSPALAAEREPRVLPRDAADRLGQLYVCYNDRICPLSTLAEEFTVKLCGSRGYRGLTPEQVLSGWLFYYDDWKREPVIRVRSAAVRRLLGVEGRFARLADFYSGGSYRLEGVQDRSAREADEKVGVVSMITTGSALRLFPYADPEECTVVWAAQTDELPESLPYEQWVFIRRAMNYVNELVVARDYEQLFGVLDKIRTYQQKEGGASLPSEGRFRAERIYHRLWGSLPAAVFLLLAGVGTFLRACRSLARAEELPRRLKVVVLTLATICFAWFTLTISLRGYVSGRWPLANGYETMQFTAWCALLLTLLLHGRFRLMPSFGCLVAGLAAMVSVMGESNPTITPLMPVLASPLLCLHVVLVMIAYAILALLMCNGAAGAIVYRTSVGESRRLMQVGRLMLYPALFCLGAGIFVGAVWANVSWGRYWGWDPKEVWALITLLLYALALHWGSLPAFRRPLFFHSFCVAAFLSVLVTYFGVNFLLGGMHSYAG